MSPRNSSVDTSLSMDQTSSSSENEFYQSKHNMSRSCELLVSWKSTRHTLLLSKDAHKCLSPIFDEFKSSVLVETEELDSPFHTLEILALFLGYLQEVLRSKRCHKSTNHRDFFREAFTAVDTDLIGDNEIHSVVGALDVSNERKKAVLAAYHNAAAFISYRHEADEPYFWRTAEAEGRGICAVFTGQGNTNADALNDLRDLWRTYKSLLHSLISSTASMVLELSKSVDASPFYENEEFDLQDWLDDEETSPDATVLASAPISFPLIGLLNLANFCIMCKVSGMSPGRAIATMKAVTGHSQGIVVAACVAKAKTWEDFYMSARLCIGILFWLGFDAHQDAPEMSLSGQQIQDSIDNGENNPSPMLSLIGLSRQKVDGLVQSANKHLTDDQKISVALVNSRENVVLSGPAKSLRGLALHVRTLKAAKGVDQGRIPYNKRKPELAAQFLPISAPFHSAYLASATERTLGRLSSTVILGSDLNTAVISTETGADLREAGDRNIIPSLVRMVNCQVVDWPAVCALPGATHFIEFGTGSFSNLLSQIKDGSGARIIAAGSLRPSDGSVGSKSELFNPRESSILGSSQSWEEKFGPRLRKTSSGKVLVETKFSKFLNMPPILVAGMTPTTVPSDFVAAISNAGYYVELAGGGYFNKEAFRKAILNVAMSTWPGQGVAVNLIYASPRAIAWQVPLLRQLIREGVPIDGMTIGAGIPSTDVAHEYITTIGLKYIGFKPGSVDSIRQVIDIANAHRDFPIVVQWTGGRGGGHHSFEDFHTPMLQMYGRIRRCQNIILVAGSGFGDAEDSYPYLTGTWAKAFGYPVMPFDAILLGSRMMVAKEAHTSIQAKKAIVDAQGVPDLGWVGSYDRDTGGVVTVLSEMGQPIHKLATRGVLFWAELDKMVFHLTGPKRLAALKANKEYIIQKLNADSAKVWFPKVSSGETAELEDMTYKEVLLRLVELMYVAKQNRWIDLSYKSIVLDFIYRIHERLAVAQDPNRYDLDRPLSLGDKVAKEVPEYQSQLLSPEDANFFLSICKRPGRKPVNFVPRLDDDFEHYFKKDSLWQSEDVDAVVDQDVGRVCILQGPMAAHYSRIVDEPASDILNSMNNAFVQNLEKDTSSTTLDATQNSVMSDSKNDPTLNNAHVEMSEKKLRLTVDERRDLPDSQLWWKFISTRITGWASEVFKVDYILQGRTKVANPIRPLFSPQHGMVIEIDLPTSERGSHMTVLKRASGGDMYEKVVSMTSTDGQTLLLDVSEHRTRDGSAATLPLKFHYDSTDMRHPITEIMQGRNSRIQNFYSALWFGQQLPAVPEASYQSTFAGAPVTLTKESVSQFLLSVGVKSHTTQSLTTDPAEIPMDAAILAVWEVLMKPLLCPEINGDLLRLVHRSNSFEYVAGASPLKVGDVLHSTSSIRGVYIEDSGKVVEVLAVIKRDGKPVMEVLSSFLFQGKYQDFENTFKIVKEPSFTLKVLSKKTQALLRDREWLVLDDGHAGLIGKELKFEPKSRYTYSAKNVIKSLQVSGKILESASERLRQVGLIKFKTGKCAGNSVTDFLGRHAVQTKEVNQLQNPLNIESTDATSFRTPRSNELYGRASGDYNPIHVSKFFATYANLPGTVTHGMYTSAIVRGMTEKWMAGGDAKRFKRWEASFVGMVLPGDKLQVRMSHVGSSKGRQSVKVTVVNETSSDTVLSGEAEVEEPRTAYIFTGQGSQSKGMGMDLYASSPVAREVWDKADEYMLENYGECECKYLFRLDTNHNSPYHRLVCFGHCSKQS